jgi:hypothetical protein
MEQKLENDLFITMISWFQTTRVTLTGISGGTLFNSRASPESETLRWRRPALRGAGRLSAVEEIKWAESRQYIEHRR